MGLVESIKVAGIRAADAVNRLNDPFPVFDRPALPKDPRRKLKDIEEEIYADLIGNFWVCDGQVLAHRLPLPQGSPLDLGDQAIWHGVYTAVLALRYHATAQASGLAFPAADQTYGHLIEAAKGLRLHQTIHAEPQPRLIRGVSDDLKTWQDDASNDSATGHLLGIYFGWKFGPETMRPVFAALAGGLGAELLNHGHALVRADGSPTTYGALEQGWKTDPLRVSLALAIYAVAATLTHQPEFINAYEALFRKYGELACYAKAKFWWVDNQGDTHRAAIHLAILADVTTGAPRQDYLRGLERMRRMVAKLGNVWVNELCKFGGYGWNPDDRDQALKVLSEFTLADKQYNPGRDNYQLMQVNQATCPWPWYRPVLWNGVYMANQPLPRRTARAQDFFWQRNLRSLDVGSSGAQADSRLNGGDFLAAYWLARYNGTLTDRD